MESRATWHKGSALPNVRKHRDSMTAENKKAYDKAYQKTPKRKAYVSERYLRFKGCEVCRDKNRCRVYLRHKRKLKSMVKGRG